MVIRRFDVFLVALDQLRAVDKARLVRRLGRISPTARRSVLAVLSEMFAP